MATRHPHQGKPKGLHSLLEWRALAEVAVLPVAWPLLTSAATGDGHPLLLMPGFGADEWSLVALKAFLQGRGYQVQTWGLGRNVGFHRRHADALAQTLRHLHHQTGRKVSLVGWSLGGVFALHGAHEAPECVRQVITLGSPVNVDASGSQSPALVKALYRLIAHPMGASAHVMQPRAKKMREHQLPPVPLSCLYSLGDGVVPPQAATVDAAPGSERENIQVAGSHNGLGFNALVLAILSDRLAQPEGQWRPFKPAGVRGSVYRWLTQQPVAA